VPAEEAVVSPIHVEGVGGREAGGDEQGKDLFERAQRPQRAEPQRGCQRSGDQAGVVGSRLGALPQVVPNTYRCR
jgi:hypothetical protein